MHDAYMSEPSQRHYRDILAANVRAARARLDLEQDVLAARMKALGYGWHRQTVGTVERARRRLSAEEILGLSLALETSISELMAPDAAAKGGLVALPSENTLPASSVSSSAGVGVNEGWLRWSGDNPIWPSSAIEQTIAGAEDRAAEARASLARRPKLRASSTEELVAETRALVQGVLDTLPNGTLSEDQQERLLGGAIEQIVHESESGEES